MTIERKFFSQSGFTLLELLLVMAIMVVLAAASTGIYLGAIRKIQLGEAGKRIIYDLKQTQANAMSNKKNQRWGVHFVNQTVGQDYYEIFSSSSTYADSSKVISSADFLPGKLEFSNPSDGLTKDIIFFKISGTTTAADAITIADPNSGNSQTIDITAQGNIN
jgi:prepilin-type N-terminal cleavage/methylation domain-containing protein